MLLQSKRVAAAICSAVLTVSLSVPVLADSSPTAAPTPAATTQAQTGKTNRKVAPTISQEQAIKIAVNKFTIPQELGAPQVHLWENSSVDQPVWNLTWEKDPRLGGTMVRYHVSVNAQTGEVTNYDYYRQDPNGDSLAKLSREDALPIAQELYAKLVPADKANHFKLEEFNRQDTLTFVWTRQVNGYPFVNDTVRITIDGVDGVLRGFNYSWDGESQFPAPDKVISQSQAQSLYNAKVGPQLIYHQFYSPSGRIPIQLVYRNKLESAVVDAFTGQLTTIPGQPWNEESKAIDLGSSSASLTKLAVPLTKEQALAMARQLLGSEAAGEPNSSSYTDASQTKSEDTGISVATWNFNWSVGNKETGQYKHLSASIDLTHGVVLHYYKNGPYLPEDKFKDLTPVAEEKARQTAIDTLKAVRPDLIGQVQLLDRSTTEKYDYIPAGRTKPLQREYNFSFTRLVNGIPFPENSVWVSVDRFSGEVKRFDCSIAEKTFPAPSVVKISAEEALQAFAAEQPLRAVYIARRLGYEEDAKTTVRLVYQPYNPWGGMFVDAVSGHFVDYSFKDITELKRGATDIANESARQEIQAMINRGVFELKDGKFNPTGTMTRGELAKALVLAFSPSRSIRLYDYAMVTSGSAPAPSYTDVNYDNGYFGYVEAAVKAGILIPKSAGEKLNPDLLVTNEELALLTVRAMGYGAMANLKTTISNGYSDGDKIAAEYRNAVGILAGLEILPNTGEFNPQGQVTRADVAKLLAGAVQKAPNNHYYW